MKDWNWTLFVIILCTAMLGAITNENITRLLDAVLFGLIIGIIGGLTAAYLTRKN